MIKFRYTILIVITIILCACTNEPKETINTPKETIEVPVFNSDSAYYFIEKQVSFGPRVISSKPWKNCAIWLENKFLQYTPNVMVQESPVTTYDGKNHTLKNIIASFSPKKVNRIALFAHWDSRHIADQSDPIINIPIDGANDGGSGVGVLLEMARQFNLKNPKIGVDIILFDAEDYGDPYSDDPTSWCLGSQYWSKNPHKKNYSARYGILLDMVAAKNATFYWEGYSNYYAKSILKKVWDRAYTSGYGKHFKREIVDPITDDHVPINKSLLLNIPTIDIIEYDRSTDSHFNKHWHTHKDDMDNIDKETIKAVGQTLLGVVYNE